jgi:acyl-CoA thioester hydrolase
MTEYKFSTPIKIRYSDLDAQWHVNHTRFLSFMEQSRFEYLMHLDLFDGKSFLDLRVIVADAHVSYLAPIQISHNVLVRTKTEKIGTKSILFKYVLEDEIKHIVFAMGEVVSVAYDFRRQESVTVPKEWRKKISDFEGQPF